MKTLRTIAFIMLSFITFNCSDKEAVSPEQITQTIPSLKSTKKLENQDLLKKVSNNYNKKLVSLRTIDGELHHLQFAWDFATISEYDNTDLQSVAAYEVGYTPGQSSYYSYGTYVDNGVVMDGGLVMHTQVVGTDQYVVDYYDVEYNEFLG